MKQRLESLLNYVVFKKRRLVQLHPPNEAVEHR